MYERRFRTGFRQHSHTEGLGVDYVKRYCAQVDRPSPAFFNAPRSYELQPVLADPARTPGVPKAVR
jgi:hypothetical protein